VTLRFGVVQFMRDMGDVFQFLVRTVFTKFFSTFYNDGDKYPLFLTALLPFLLMFVVDIVFSFVLSIRAREVRFFNVLSPRSWRTFNSSAYNSLPPDRLKAATPANRHASTFTNIHMPFIYRVNDTIRLRSGVHALYLGTKYINGQKAFVYRIGGKIYSSTLRPGKLGKIQFNFITNNNTTNNNSYYGSDGCSDDGDCSSSNSPEVVTPVRSFDFSQYPTLDDYHRLYPELSLSKDDYSSWRTSQGNSSNHVNSKANIDIHVDDD
jgi:hypothetical protein